MGIVSNYYKVECRVDDFKDLTHDDLQEMVINLVKTEYNPIIKLYNIKEIPSLYGHVAQRVFIGNARLLKHNWGYTNSNPIFTVYFTKDSDGDYFIELNWGMSNEKYINRQLIMPKDYKDYNNRG